MRIVTIAINLSIIIFILTMAIFALRALLLKPQWLRDLRLWQQEMKYLKAEKAGALFHGNWEQTTSVDARIHSHSELKPDIPFWAFWM
jgi:hypothetical protein